MSLPPMEPQPIIPTVECDVLIIGSGPLGATYARRLFEMDKERGKIGKVIMVEAGAQESDVAGEHKKNAVVYQKNIDSFVNVIHGSLFPTSIPTNDNTTPTLPPISWSPDGKQIFNGQNPEQDARKNLDANSVSRNVGGMSTHWTCATPRQHRELERPEGFFDDNEWERLYDMAEQYIGTDTRNNVLKDSIRQTVVLDTLRRLADKPPFSDLFPNTKPKPLPIAAKKRENVNLIDWSSSATVLSALPETIKNEKFELWSQHICKELYKHHLKNEIQGARLKDLKTGQRKNILAKKYVICGGPILTPQLLYASGFSPERNARSTTYLPALGHYLTEQTMTFCQVVLKREIVKELREGGRIYDTVLSETQKEAMKRHVREHPNDPLPIPFDDLDPQTTLPVSGPQVSTEIFPTTQHVFPWHTQIHRDAFAYGAVPPSIDKRIIVDLRFFGMIEAQYKNRVKFEGFGDGYGMPQPTFEFELGDKDREDSHRMMKAMELVASEFGGYLPGSEPQFMAPGLALHVCGTTRAGTVDNGESCCNANSRVWGFDELYLGGLNVLPRANASNPTLTAMCFGIKGAEDLYQNLPEPAT